MYVKQSLPTGCSGWTPHLLKWEKNHLTALIHHSNNEVTAYKYIRYDKNLN